MAHGGLGAVGDQVRRGSCDGRMLGGVCWWIAGRTGVSVAVVRGIAIALACAAGGFVVPAYVAAAVALDSGRRRGGLRVPALRAPDRQVVGWFLIAAGAFGLAALLPGISPLHVASVGAVVIGINVVLRARAADDQ